MAIMIDEDDIVLYLFTLEELIVVIINGNLVFYIILLIVQLSYGHLSLLPR